MHAPNASGEMACVLDKTKAYLQRNVGEITPDGTGGSLHVKSGLDILPNALISMGEFNKRKLENREGY